MLIFGNDRNTRGCFLATRLDTSEGRSTQLALPDGMMLPEEEYSFPLTTTGFSFNQAEDASFVKCFGDRVYTYAFGHNPASQLNITFAAMLRAGTTAGSSSGSSFSRITDTMLKRYEANRLTTSLKYAKFSVGGTQVLKGFIVAMSSVTMNPEVSLQQFNITLQLVEAQGK